MNKREIAEIKRLFTLKNNPINAMRGYLVCEEKNVISQMDETIWSKSDEELMKYLEIFKKSFSGAQGKNLVNMDTRMGTPLNDKICTVIEGGSNMDEDDAAELVQDIIDNYDYAGKYYIILAHGTYDIPGKTMNNEELFDASEEVYDFMLCCICPVYLDKPALGLNEGEVKERIRSWYIGKPDISFLYPSFTGRRADASRFLLYRRNKNDKQERMVNNVLRCYTKETPDRQKFLFDQVVENAPEKTVRYTDMIRLYKRISNQIFANDLDGKSTVINLGDAARLIARNYEEARDIEEKIDSMYGEKQIDMQNIVGKKLQIEADSVIMKMDPDDAENVELKILHGKPYLLVPANTVYVNGIPVLSEERAEQENDLPGQMSVEDYPQMMPEKKNV